MNIPPQLPGMLAARAQLIDRVHAAGEALEAQKKLHAMTVDPLQAQIKEMNQRLARNINGPGQSGMTQ